VNKDLKILFYRIALHAHVSFYYRWNIRLRLRQVDYFQPVCTTDANENILYARFAFDFFNMVRICRLLIVAGFIKGFYSLTINLHRDYFTQFKIEIKTR